MPAYKTIVLELLRDRPALHERLRAEDTLLPCLERLATALRSCHLGWINQLAVTQPGSDRAQLSSEALELALKELEESLPRPSSPSEDSMEIFSLDQAMAFLQRHMPAG